LATISEVENRKEVYNEVMIKRHLWAYVLVMVVIIVAMDIIFFKHRFGERLIANIVIVLAFIAIYLGLLKHK
jgi:preprotein translocase subunit SecE